MKKALMIASVLLIAVISTACINNIAVQELNNKAAEFMQKGDYESAMNRLQASLDLDSTLYETHYNLGVAAINAGKYEKAIEALENGLKLKPDYVEFYYSLGVAQAELADEIIDSDDSDDNEHKPTQEELDKVKSLRIASNENLSKYLEEVPSSKDKETIEELILENNKFIENDDNLVKVEK